MPDIDLCNGCWLPTALTMIFAGLNSRARLRPGWLQPCLYSEPIVQLAVQEEIAEIAARALVEVAAVTRKSRSGTLNGSNWLPTASVGLISGL